MFSEYAILDKASKKLMTTTALAVLECILDIGIDEFIKQVGADDVDVRAFPNIRRKFEELGIGVEGGLYGS